VLVDAIDQGPVQIEDERRVGFPAGIKMLYALLMTPPILFPQVPYRKCGIRLRATGGTDRLSVDGSNALDEG
jgi:hypothetical protein